MNSTKTKFSIEEIEFTKYFKEVGKIRVINKYHSRMYAVFWKREFPLFNPYSLLQRDFYEIGTTVSRKRIGSIDVVFRYRHRLLIGEVKYYMPHSREFWDACKTLAYTAYYNWQNETSEGFDPAHPAVLVPKNSVKLEHQIVAGKLKILILGIEKLKDGGYSLEEMACPFD